MAARIGTLSEPSPPAGAASRRPSITVVVPVYNLEDCIVDTLRSILDQTDLPDEVIVVDDGSTDRTRARVTSLIIESGVSFLRLIEMGHEGPGAARNRGISEARSEWVAFLDGDDLWLPEKLERARAAIVSSPRAAMFAHVCDERLMDGRLVKIRSERHFHPDHHLLPQLYRTSFLATSSVMVRTDALRSAGGFDASLGASQDYDLWLRLARDVNLVFLSAALGIYAHRAGSVSSQLLMRYRCQLRIAYRHAPALVPLVGAFEAYRLRLRLVLIAHHSVLTAPWNVNRSAIARVLVAAPAQLLRAIIQPIGDLAGSDTPTLLAGPMREGR
jgi:glycosyltransferase involved in cell wall biosynthesis